MAQLAFVLLGRTEPIKPDEFTAALGARLGRTLKAEASENGEDIFSVVLPNGRTTFVAFVPAPVPDGEAEQFVPYSISAVGSGWQLPEYPAHAMVTLMGDEDTVTIESLDLFTKVVAAVVESSTAVGVYWGATGATHNAEFVLDVANAEGLLPVMLWNGISIADGGPGRLSMLSLGMEQLGLPNLMLTTPSERGNAAIEMMLDLLNFLIERGEPIPEGDTIGFTAEQRLPIRYETSPIDPEKQVWCVDL
jgi:hypothetical protein